MPEPAIRLSEVTKDFALGLRGVKLRAIDHLDLEVGEGKIYGLLGPNGSGKSTTIKVVLGLLRPTLGRCSVFGVDSAEVAARRGVGYLPEAPYFYRWLTGRELVAFFAKVGGVPRAELGRRVAEAVELAGMTEAAGRRVGTYSKGMLQRIGLAQALVHDPDLVILDEPTAGVDPIGAAAIGEIILELKRRGKTVLLCSHLLSQVERLCDRIAILDRGRLILEGPVDELLTGGASTVRSLRVGGYRESLRAPLEALLAEHGARLEAVEEPRAGLDELFLREVQPRGEKAGEAAAGGTAGGLDREAGAGREGGEE